MIVLDLFVFLMYSLIRRMPRFVSGSEVLFAVYLMSFFLTMNVTFAFALINNSSFNPAIFVVIYLFVSVLLERFRYNHAHIVKVTRRFYSVNNVTKFLLYAALMIYMALSFLSFLLL